MMRFIFMLLLVANLGLAAWIYLNSLQPRVEPPAEINPDALKIVAIVDPAKGAQDAQAAKELAATLSGSACVTFNVKPADSQRAQERFVTMNLGERLTALNVEEPTRFAVIISPRKDRKTAEVTAANLKKQGIKDISILADHSISLGVFSTLEAAKRYLVDIEAKGAKEAQISPRNMQSKETIFTVREPDTDIVARLTVMQRDFDGSALQATPCVTATKANGTPPG